MKTTLKLPKCIIYGLPSDSKKDEVQEAIDLNFPNNNSPDLKFLFSVKGRMGKLHWVFQTPPEILKAIYQNKNKMFVNWESHKVKEFLSFRKCTRCQSYDHTTQKCDSHYPYCNFCAKNTCKSTVEAQSHHA
ncbi:hypothetical protein AVEN_137257-1 [Araneus ventricosus]|uniref:Pre-C2HC domain-containing protein n=1 Tax=Araneus ventricosus TaxID=182803 RepID=A0A4Y2DPZ4_ARAVE|nr:hypothetical protein AVEN_137257-1 [Araneus ventricosus]